MLARWLARGIAEECKCCQFIIVRHGHHCNMLQPATPMQLHNLSDMFSKGLDLAHYL